MAKDYYMPLNKRLRTVLYVLMLLSIMLPSCCAMIKQTSRVDVSELSYVVEEFGRRLQAVSLVSPQAHEEINEQYADFVSAELLQEWMNDTSRAPGRYTSSPWPDRIEIESIVEETVDKYLVTGDVVEVTSVEAASGGAANRIPVKITLENKDGRWVITEYVQH